MRVLTRELKYSGNSNKKNKPVEVFNNFERKELEKQHSSYHRRLSLLY